MAAAAALGGESEQGRQSQGIGLWSLADTRLDLPSARAGADEVLRDKVGLTAESTGRATLNLDRRVSSAVAADGDGADGGDNSRANNGGAASFEHLASDRRGLQAQGEGEAFLLTPSELLAATLEEFSAAVGEFSEVSKAWLEEASCCFFFALSFLRKEFLRLVVSKNRVNLFCFLF